MSRCDSRLSNKWFSRWHLVQGWCSGWPWVILCLINICHKCMLMQRLYNQWNYRLSILSSLIVKFLSLSEEVAKESLLQILILKVVFNKLYRSSHNLNHSLLKILSKCQVQLQEKIKLPELKSCPWSRHFWATRLPLLSSQSNRKISSILLASKLLLSKFSKSSSKTKKLSRRWKKTSTFKTTSKLRIWPIRPTKNPSNLRKVTMRNMTKKTWKRIMTIRGLTILEFKIIPLMIHNLGNRQINQITQWMLLTHLMRLRLSALDRKRKRLC